MGIDIHEEIRVWRQITWPFIKQNLRADLRRVRWWYLGMIPPALQWWPMELELRREMNKDKETP